jgi:hypothetical protein
MSWGSLRVSRKGSRLDCSGGLRDDTVKRAAAAQWSGTRGRSGPGLETSLRVSMSGEKARRAALVISECASSVAMAGECVRYGGGGRFSSGAIAAVFPGSRARLGEVGGRGWREAGRELQHTNTLDLQLTDSYSTAVQCTSMHAIRARRRAVKLLQS